MYDLRTTAKVQAGGFAGRMSHTNVLLLKAALLDGDSALAAYAAWRATLDLETISIGEQRLLPLLHRNLRRLGVSDSLSNRFRGVRRFYWVANRKRMKFAREVFEALNRAEVPFIVIKGAALAACYLEDPSLRPMYDVDILVTEERLADAAAVLAEKQLLPQGLPLGYVVTSDRLRSFVPGWAFGDHERSIDLHWKALHFDLRPQADDEFWRAAREATLDGTAFRVFNPADQLLHICAHAAQRGGAEAMHTWPADMALVIRGSPDLSFERLVAGAARHRISAIMADALCLLADEFDLSVPRSAIASLRRAATWSERAEMRLADRPYPSLSAPARMLLELQDFRRGSHNPCHGGWASPGSGASVVRGIQTSLGNPGWLRRLLGRDRHRRVRDPSRLPKVGDELKLAGFSIDESPLVSGWSVLEPTGCWTLGREATIAWSVSGHEGELELRVDGHAFLHKNAPAQSVQLWVNDRQAAHWQFRAGGASPLPARIAIPAAVVRNRDVLMLTFVIQSPCSPAEVGESSDPRALGLHLRSISLTRAAVLDTADGILAKPTWLQRTLGHDRYRVIPALDRLPRVGDKLNLVSPNVNETPLIAGWSHSEPTGRWTVGQEATIAWSVRGHEGELELRVDGHAFLHKNAPTKSITLWLNDRQAAHWQFRAGSGSPLPARIAIPAAWVGNRDVLMLTFVIESPCSPAAVGESPDPRALGFHLRSISLTKPA